MMDFRRLNPMLAIMVALTLAACGGGGGSATTAPTGAAVTSGPTQATTTDAPTTDAPATGAPAATDAPAGGGGSAADVCGLVTADELASILDVSSVVLTVFQGPPDTCDIQSGDGALLAATVLTVDGAITFGFIKAGSGVQEVPGLGDEAIYIPDSLLLVVRKGDSMVSIAVFDDGRSESERLELMKQIGTIAAGRM